MRAISSLIALSVFIFSCTDHQENPPDGQPQDTCVVYPGLSWGSIQTRNYNFSHPCFNPINSDEFVYFRYEQESYTPPYELRKHTISNEQDVVVCNVSDRISPMSWGGGLIYFCDQNNNVWRVKENGSQQSQFTYTGGMFHPSCSPDGKYIVLHQLLGSSAQTVVLDSSGSFLDTIGATYISKTWINDTLLFLIFPGIGFNDATWKILSYPGKTEHGNGNFFQQTELLVAVGDHLILHSNGECYLFNTLTLTNELFIPICGDRYAYAMPSYAQQSHKILMEQQGLTLIDSVTNVYFRWHDIILMDENGGNEHVIALPQN